MKQKLFCLILEKVGKKLLNLFIFLNLGNGIIQNIGLLSIHRYLLSLFFTPQISNIAKIVIWNMPFPRFERLSIQFFVMHLFFPVGGSIIIIMSTERFRLEKVSGGMEKYRLMQTMFLLRCL